MADNNYDNSGALWKRQATPKDEPGKKYPHYTGNVTLNGVSQYKVQRLIFLSVQ